MDDAIATAQRQLSHKKNCLPPVLVTKGSRILEKMVNETQVSKTLFGHLNLLKGAPQYETNLCSV